MGRRASIFVWLGLAACASPLALAQARAAGLGQAAPAPPAVEPAAVDDPFEPVNRVMFAIDRELNRLLGKHSVFGGAGFLPEKLRTPLYNFFNNLDEPANAANDLLQRKWKRSAVATGRFATNSTVGLLGTVDMASRLGLPRHREDFGQTLGLYGVKSGPYIFIPLSGPTSLRDAAGDKVDGFTRPLHWVNMDTPARKAITVTHHVVQPHIIGIRQQARAAADRGETTDEYATLRQLYFNQRQAEIEDRSTGDFNLPKPPPPARGVHPVRADNRQAPGWSRQQAGPVDVAALPPAHNRNPHPGWGVAPIDASSLPPARGEDGASRALDQARRDAAG